MLHTMSMLQALELWSDLEKAYHGTNPYGSDTAEVYLYRVMPNPPRHEWLDKAGIMGDLAREEVQTANVALHDFLALFAKTREASLTVEDKELGPWLKEARFSHRVHVTVTPSRPRQSHAHQHALHALEGLTSSLRVYLGENPPDADDTTRELYSWLRRAEQVLNVK